MYALTLITVVPSAQEQLVASQTVWDFLISGGYIMIPLAICSVIVLALTMERYLSLSRRKVVPVGVDAAVELLRSGNHEDAIAAAQELNAPVGRILVCGIRRHGHALEDIERAMEDQGQREVQKLRGNIRPLNLIASVAPLLGLLGTVIGIQHSFALVVKAGMGKPENFAGGIEQALVTTIIGLTVAIPALFIAAHLQTKVRRLMIEADERLSPAVDLLAEIKE